VAGGRETMRICGVTIHRGPCQGDSTVFYREGVDRRTGSQIALDGGHGTECERVTHPNSLHLCNCGVWPIGEKV